MASVLSPLRRRPKSPCFPRRTACRRHKKMVFGRKVLFLHKYHPWCPYLFVLGCSWPNCFPVLIISTRFFHSLASFLSLIFLSPLSSVFQISSTYFFCFSAICFAWATFADMIPASISLGTITFAPRGLITTPNAGQMFPFGSLRRIIAA